MNERQLPFESAVGVLVGRERVDVEPVGDVVPLARFAHEAPEVALLLLTQRVGEGLPDIHDNRVGAARANLYSIVERTTAVTSLVTFDPGCSPQNCTHCTHAG